MQHNFTNRALRILLITNALIMLAGAMLGPIYALFIEGIGGSLLDASYAYGVFALTAGITTYLSGKYGDRVKENEYIIIIGYTVMGIGFFLYLFVDSIWFLLLVQVIVGFGEAIYSPVFDSIYSKHLDHGKAGSQWGAWEAMYYFTTAIGAVIGGFIVDRFDFGFLFIVMSLLSFMSALYLFFLPRKVL